MLGYVDSTTFKKMDKVCESAQVFKGRRMVYKLYPEYFHSIERLIEELVEDGERIRGVIFDPTTKIHTVYLEN